jgi:hypothetical protein
MLGSARCDFHKKCTGTCYAKLVFLCLTASTGHVVHSGASGHETSMHYFRYSGGPDAVSIKNALGHVTLNLCFFASDVICG